MQPHPRKIAPRLYGIIHMVLWAGLAAWLAILLSSLPRMSVARAIAQRERAQELIAENQSYCTKWGLVSGSHEYTLCTMDVQEIRAKHERRLAETAF
jgi:hypothetical protein